MIEADFTTCALPPSNVLIYLFNPCHETEMRKLVANIKERVVAEPREAYILYVNPTLRHLIDEAQFTRAVGGSDKWLSYRCTDSRQLPAPLAA